MNLLDMKYTSSASSLYSNPTLQTNQKQLESRLNSYFQNKHTLNNKSQSKNEPTSSYKHLFPNPQFNKHNSHSNLQNISSNKNISNTQLKYQTPIGKQQCGNQNVLSKKKLNLMQFKLKQLQQQIEIQLQDKLCIFKRNEEIQKQIDRFNEISSDKQNRKTQNNDREFNYELMELETVLRKQREKNRDKRQFIQKLNQNRKQQVRVKSCTEQKYKSSRNSISSQSKQMAQLRAELEQQRNNYKNLKQKYQNNQELKNLSSQLKRLKKMVEKQSKTKRK